MIKIARLGFAFAFALATLIANTADAGNPINPKAENRTFKLNTKLTQSDYLPNVIVFKIKPAFKNAISKSQIGIPSLQSAIQKISGSELIQKYPNAKVAGNKFTVEGNLTTDISLIYEIKFNPNISIENAINEILKSPEVAYAEPHYIYAPSYKPNDPDTLGTKNYYLKITKAYQAWDVTKGDTNVVIAIVDSGSDLDHPDLAANQYKNYADPVNGLDDDNDGYIDNFIGWDFAGADFNTIVEDNNANCLGSNNNHGSHVSGDASAVTDNGIGVSGMGFNCRILTIKCSADNDTRAPGGVGYILTGYEAIVYAADHGADIINCSWGGGGGGQAGQDAIDYATQQGSLVIAAAGNSNNADPHFPSSFVGVLSVASTNSTDRKSGFSNFGNSIDVSAPGSGIYSTVFNNSYASFDGTSMASPIAAGAAALVKSVFPSFTPLQVAEQLRVTCDDIDAKNISFKTKLGKGRINAFRAVTDVTSPSVRSKNLEVLDNTNGGRLLGDTVTISTHFINYLRPTSANFTVTASLLTASTYITFINDQITQGVIPTLAILPGNGTISFVVNPNAPEDALLSIKLSYTDGAYTDFEMIPIVVNVSSLNITVNQISTTATGIGKVGFADEGLTRGLGFKYKNINMLYEGALMVGASPTQVSNCARSESASPDNNFSSITRVAKSNQAGFDFLSMGKFNDAFANPPLDLEIKHREMAWNSAPDDKYAIFEYTIKNTSSTTYTNLYPGMFFDWDIASSSNNRIAYDSINTLAYAQTLVASDPWAGVKILTTSTPGSPAFYPQSYQIPGDLQENGFSIAEKYTSLSSGIFSDSLGYISANGNDVMYTVGAGPYSLAPNSSIVFALAIIGGDSLSDLQSSAQAAQIKYNSAPTSGINQLNEIASSFTTYPNPTENITNFSFNLNKETKTSLIIYNQLGQEVKAVLNKKLSAGNHSYSSNVSDLASGIYNYVLKTENQVKSGKLIIK